MNFKRLSLVLAVLGSFRSAFGFENDREEHHRTRAGGELNETPIITARKFLDQCSKGKNVKYYYFKFEDGSLANGITDQDVAYFNLDGNELKLDITCIDTFTGGYGTIEGPVAGLNPAVMIWEIVNCKSGEIYESCNHSHGAEMIAQMATTLKINSKGLKGGRGRSLMKSTNKDENVSSNYIFSFSNKTNIKLAKKGEKASKNKTLTKSSKDKKYKATKNGGKASKNKMTKHGEKASKYETTSEVELKPKNKTTSNGEMPSKSKISKKGSKESNYKTPKGSKSPKYRSTKKGKTESKNKMVTSTTSENGNAVKSPIVFKEEFNMSYIVNSYGYAVNGALEDIDESKSTATKKQSKNMKANVSAKDSKYKTTPKGGKYSKNKTAKKGENESKYKTTPKGGKYSMNKTAKKGEKESKYKTSPMGGKYSKKKLAKNGEKASSYKTTPTGGKKSDKDISKKGEKESKYKKTPKGRKESKNKMDKKYVKESKNKMDKKDVKQSKFDTTPMGKKTTKTSNGEDESNMSDYVNSYGYVVRMADLDYILTSILDAHSKTSKKGKKGTKTSKGEDLSNMSYFVNSYDYLLDNILMSMPYTQIKNSKKGKKSTKTSKGGDVSNMSYLLNSYGYAVKVDLNNIVMSMPDPQSKTSKKGEKATKPSFFEDPFNMSYLVHSYGYAEDVSAENILKSLPVSSFLRQANEGSLESNPVSVSLSPVAKMETSHNSGNGNAAIIGGTVGFAAVASLVAILLKKKYSQSSNTAGLDQVHEVSL